MRTKNGFVLIELLAVCSVLLILAAIALPSFVQMQRVQNQQAALKRVQQVAWAQSTVALCSLNPGCNPGAALPLIPQPGTLQIGSYQYVFTLAGADWTYSAVPTGSQSGQTLSYFVDQTSLVRCALGAANGASPVCN